MKKMAVVLNIVVLLSCSMMLNGFTHEFQNGTQHLAEFSVSYYACQDLKFTINPGESTLISAQECKLKNVEAKIIKANREIDTAHLEGSGYNGSALWALIGPVVATTKDPLSSIYKIWRVDLGTTGIEK